MGEHPNEDLLKQTLWNAMDVTARVAMQSSGQDTLEYREFCDHIDQKYKATHGHIDFSSRKNDPMDINKLGTREEPEPAAPSGDEVNLDAFGNPKGGKGKGGGGKGDFRRRRSNGRDHMERDCPTIAGSTSTVECHECGGKGHYKDKCPVFLEEEWSVEPQGGKRRQRQRRRMAKQRLSAERLAEQRKRERQ